MFHRARLRVFVYATEDRGKVMRALKNTGLTGDIRSSMAEGAYGDRIEIIEMVAKKRRDIDAFLSKIGKEGIERILGNLDERVDDGGVLHFRIHKQSACEGNIEITGGGDVIAAEMKIMVYPFRRESAVKSAKEYLERFL